MTYPISVNFGPLHGNLASSVMYSVIAPDEAVVVAPTNQGVLESVPGSGDYHVDLSLQPVWGFVRVLWTLAGTALSASSMLDLRPLPGSIGGSTTVASGGFSYDPSAVAVSALSYIRLRLFDTDAETAILSDAEILGYVEALGVRSAAVACAKAVAAALARRSKVTSNEQTRIEYDARSALVLDIADRLLVEPLPLAFEAHFTGMSVVGQVESPKEHLL